MKLMIEITEEDFTTIREYGFNGYSDQHNRIVNAIADGIPLEQIRDEILFVAEKCLPNCIAEEYEVKGLKEALNIIDKYTK